MRRIIQPVRSKSARPRLRSLLSAENLVPNINPGILMNKTRRNRDEDAEEEDAEEKVEERIRMEMVSSAKERMDGIEEKTSKLEGRLKDAQEEAKVSGERVNELTTLNDLAAGREAKLIEKVAELERRIAELSGEAPMDVPGSAPASLSAHGTRAYCHPQLLHC